jgi:hypothetical protein
MPFVFSPLFSFFFFSFRFLMPFSSRFFMLSCFLQFRYLFHTCPTAYGEHDTLVSCAHLRAQLGMVVAWSFELVTARQLGSLGC